MDDPRESLAHVERLHLMHDRTPSGTVRRLDQLREENRALAAELKVADARLDRAVSADIGARELAQSESSKSEQRLRDFAASASEWFWEMDESLRFVYLSDRSAQAAGIDPASAYDRVRGEIGNAGLAEEGWVQHLADLEARRPFTDFEYTFDSPDGGTLRISISGRPFFDEEENFRGYRGAAADITELRKTEDRSRASSQELLRLGEGRFEILAQSAPVGIFYASADGIAQYVNQKLAQIAGYPVAELVGELWYPRIHPDDRDEVTEQWLSNVNSTESWDAEFRFQGLDGSVSWVRGLTTPQLDSTGKVIGHAGTITDITDRKEAAHRLQEAHDTLEQRVAERTEELRSTQKSAEQANKAKSEFISRISHELRTPMNSILGFSQLLETDHSEPLSERQQEFVAHILGAGQHLLILIDEVLDLSRIESGRMQLFMEMVDPGEVLQECVHLIQPLAEKHRVILEVRETPKTVPAVRADRTRLKQILLNLMSNAVKYNHAGGRAMVMCDEVSDEVIRISVTDTGPGLPEGRKDEVFEPFARLGAERSEVEGTGIGLSITKRLVELMGGTLGVQSTPGEGSTFWVALERDLRPATLEGESEIQATVTLGSHTEPNPCKVLYIEDDPASLALMRAALRRPLGAVLLDAPNAELGLGLAQSKRPDVILMDINLPGMDGIEVLTTLKSDKATRAIPVIAVSAGAMPREIERGRAAGFFDYLTKPVNLAKLNSTIDRAVPRLQQRV